MTLPLPQFLTAPYDLHGEALLDCYRGEADATLICHQDGERDDVPAAFWLRDSFDPLESAMMGLCRGRILDLGAGAGIHALALQKRGLEVVALDISSACVAIMRERGVRNACQGDMYDFHAPPFDTVACFCNGLDKIGQLADLPRFLDKMRTLVAHGGQLLADSFDVRTNAGPEELARYAAKQAEGRYFGELELAFEYRGKRSEPFSVLQLDFDTLHDVPDSAGWGCEKIAETGGHYFVRMQPFG